MIHVCLGNFLPMESSGPSASLGSILFKVAEAEGGKNWRFHCATPASLDRRYSPVETLIHRRTLFRYLLWLLFVLVGPRARPQIFWVQSIFYWRSLLAILTLSLRFPVVISPRGELDSAALSYRPVAKHLVIAILQTLVRFRGQKLGWIVTSHREKEEVENCFLDGLSQVIMFKNKYSVQYISYLEASCSEASEVQNIDGLRIGTLGRLHPKKNISFLIDAVKALPLSEAGQASWVLDICGDGPDKRTLLDQAEASAISDLVHFRGEITGRQKLSWYESVDVFVLPSLGENFGNVVVEAGLSGCVVLASDATPWEELLGVWARSRFELGTTDELVSILTSLVELKRSRPDELDALRTRFRAYFLKTYMLLDRDMSNLESYFQRVGGEI